MINTITYIEELDNIKTEETLIVTSVEGNKVYCIDDNGKKMIFNKDTGYCYSSNPSFKAKQYLKL